MSSWSDVVACASDDAASTFLEHGVAVIPNAVDDATIDACRTRAIEDLAAPEASQGNGVDVPEIWRKGNVTA